MAYSKSWSEPFHSLRYSWFKTGVGAIQKSGLPDYTALLQRRDGEKMPDWKSKTRQGLNATTPFYSDRRKIVSYRPCTISLSEISTSGGATVTLRGQSGSIYPDRTINHLTVNSSKARSIALSKLYKKLDSELSRLNSPAVIAEFLDVVRQFGKPFEALVGLTHRRINRLYLEKRGLSGSTVFKQKKFLDIAAATYLEYSFGLKPLISDTKAAAEALAHWRDESTEEILQKLRSKAVSRGLDSTSSVTHSVSSSTLSQCFWDYTTKKTTEARAQYVCGLQGDLRADFGSNDRLLQLLGFDHGNWVPAAWEAVPWSWLVDYFANVGAILEASVTSSARVSWISLTETSATTNVQVAKFLEWRASGMYQKLTGLDLGPTLGTEFAKGIRKTVTRSIPASLGIPPLYLQHPLENVGKLTNMAAVLLGKRSQANQLWLF